MIANILVEKIATCWISYLKNQKILFANNKPDLSIIFYPLTRNQQFIDINNSTDRIYKLLMFKDLLEKFNVKHYNLSLPQPVHWMVTDADFFNYFLQVKESDRVNLSDSSIIES